MEKNRIDYIDIAKGIGMLCVILGHLSVSGINMVVFTFHMPLFFIISGYFFKKQDMETLVCTKFLQLMVPYLLTCLGFLILSVLRDCLLGHTGAIGYNLFMWLYAASYGSGGSYAYPFSIKAIGAIWFLFAMFWSLIIYNCIMDRKGCTLWVLLLALAGYFSAKYVWLPWSIQSAMLALVFVHAGHCFRKRKELITSCRFWTVFALFLWLLCMYVDKGRFYMVQNYSENLVVDVIGGIAGTWLVICLGKGLERIPLLSGALGWFGRNSLAVLCLHLTELTFIPWETLWEYMGVTDALLAGVLTVAGKLLWCIVGILAMGRIPALAAGFRLAK